MREYLPNIHSEYFRFCEGKIVSMDRIKSENPNMKYAVGIMVKTGHAVGQYTLDGDILIWKTKK